MARLRQEAPPQLAVSVVTEMEVEYGLARNPNLAPRVREAMRMLLNTISVLPFEREDARGGAIARKPEQPGVTPIGAYDLVCWFALVRCPPRKEIVFKIVTQQCLRDYSVRSPSADLGFEDWAHCH